MFGLFKKNKVKSSRLPFVDLEGNELKSGDKVISFRYDMGECIIGEDENGYYYESIEIKKRVPWGLMVDAATERQKVRKIAK